MVDDGDSACWIRECRNHLLYFDFLFIWFVLLVLLFFLRKVCFIFSMASRY